MAIYTRRFARLGARIEIGVNNVVKAVAVAVDQTVVTATPVDTGRARSNWIVSLGSPSSVVIPTLGPGALAAAIAQGASVIASRRLKESIHITNNLPYIGLLNAGSSRKAPAGFVQLSVDNGFTTAATAAPGILARAINSGR